MNAFEYIRPEGMDAALAQAASSRFIAGGTNLIDLMKEGVLRPTRLVDANALTSTEPGLGLASIEPTPAGGLQLGALARNAYTAHHPLVGKRYPLLRAAILAGASPQIRNMASNGGNLLQRTRCVYFYDVGTPCNKRAPGSGCPAREGHARQLAILGTSEHCIATHPSDMCVALAALEAVVHVRGPRGMREIAFADFHRLPGERPQDDTTLAPEELITHLELPAHSAALAGHSTYLKLRDRASYAFALVSVAAGLELRADGSTIEQARIALGGVAHKPWRVPEAEALLQGRRVDDESALQAAAQRLLQGAQACGTGLGSNGFKIPMARRAIVRALQMAAQGTLTNTGEDRE